MDGLNSVCSLLRRESFPMMLRHRHLSSEDLGCRMLTSWTRIPLSCQVVSGRGGSVQMSSWTGRLR